MAEQKQKVHATRASVVPMNNIISTNQKCGLPNRRIEQILMNVHTAFEIAEEKNKTLGLFLGDFETAFDRLSHEFVFKIIKTLGFEQNMQNWIKLLSKNIYSNVELNGALTKPVQIKRGIRLGCPISMILFITTTDALTRHIEKEKKILAIRN